MSVHVQAAGQMNGGGCDPASDATLSTVAVETMVEL